MNYVQQWEPQGEIREFSTKEVCRIISVIKLMNKKRIPDEISMEDIIQSCFVYNSHSENDIMTICEHIRKTGVHNIANTIANSIESEH